MPYSVGTTAHIRQVENLEDGRYNILVMGLHRFRIRQLHFDMPYLQGDVEAFPLRAKAGGQYGQLDAIRVLLDRYMDLLSQVTDAEITMDAMPDDPRTLAFLAASVLQIPWDDKQELLGTPELETLLAMERKLLGREYMMLQYMHATHAEMEEKAQGPSGYLLPN